MRTICIIGFGRFSKTLVRLLDGDFTISIYSRRKHRHKNYKNARFLQSQTDVFKSEIIIFAIPISALESTVKKYSKYINDNHVLIDVCSVKEHPKSVFTKYIHNKKTNILLTHPMFGPDSSQHGFNGLPFIMDRFRCSIQEYNFWKKYFKSKKLNVVEMSAEKHDKLAANSQIVTHFIGRLLELVKFKPTIVDSVGTRNLHTIRKHTINDSWDLFYEMQKFNKHAKKTQVNLERAFNELMRSLR